MNNSPRFYLWLALAVVLWINYTTWQREYPPLPAASAAPSQTVPSKQSSSLANTIPQLQQSNAPSGAAASPAIAAAPPPPAAAVAGIPAVVPEASANAPLIHVHTDVYDINISTRGGTVEQVHLLKYAEIKGQAARVELENDAGPRRCICCRADSRDREIPRTRITPRSLRRHSKVMTWAARSSCACRSPGAAAASR